MSSLCSYQMEILGEKDKVLGFCADIFDGCSALDVKGEEIRPGEYAVHIDNTCKNSLDYEFGTNGTTGYNELVKKSAQYQVVFSAVSFNDALEFSERLFIDRGVTIAEERCEYFEFCRSDYSPDEWIGLQTKYDQPENEYECDSEFIKVAINPVCLPNILTYNPIGNTGRSPF